MLYWVWFSVMEGPVLVAPSWMRVALTLDKTSSVGSPPCDCTSIWTLGASRADIAMIGGSPAPPSSPRVGAGLTMVTMTFVGWPTSMPDVSAIRGASLVPSRPVSVNATPASDVGASGSWMIPRSPGPLSWGTIPDGNVGFELEHASNHVAPRIAHVVRNTDA